MTTREPSILDVVEVNVVDRYSLSTNIGGKSIVLNKNGALVLHKDYKELEDKYNDLYTKTYRLVGPVSDKDFFDPHD